MSTGFQVTSVTTINRGQNQMKLARMAVTMAAAAAVSSLAAKADQFFSNLDQQTHGGFLTAADLVAGTSLKTGSQAVMVDSITLEEFSYDSQTAATLKIALLQKKVQGASVVFESLGELGNPVVSGTDGQHGTTYVAH